MKKLRRVVWSKGMFLTPQHFQTQDRFQEEAMQFRFASSTFANWGVVRVDIDREALVNGQFVLRQASGLMPDGMPFSFPESDEGPAARALAEFFGPSDDHVDVYLTIPERRPEGKNVTQQAAGADPTQASTRLVAETVEVTDEILSEEQKPLQVSRKNFRILFGGQSLDGYSALRIARVARTGAGAYTLAPEFIAPCLEILSSEFLMTLLRRQIELLGSKANLLGAARRQRGQNTAEFNVSEVASFWLLHTVNSFLPELRHYWAVRRGHPELLFLAMLRLAGALSTFSLESRSRDLPDYDHNELGVCFAALDERIQSLIETVIPSKCISIPLRLVDQSTWAGLFDNEEYLKNSQLFLAVGAPLGVDDVIKRVTQLVKISAANEIGNFVRLALPGVTLRHSPSPPPSIPFKLDNQYFLLNQSGVQWERIAQTKTIALFVPPDIPNPKLELLIVLSNQAERADSIARMFGAALAGVQPIE